MLPAALLREVSQQPARRAGSPKQRTGTHADAAMQLGGACAHHGA